MYDFASNELLAVRVPGELMKTIGVSPDRRYLLYEYDSGTEDEYRLAVIDDQGQVIKDFDNRYKQERWDYYNWQNSEEIRVVKTSQDGVFPRIFSLFVENYSVLSTELENSYKGKGLDWGFDNRAIETLYYNGANILYDPTITRIIYPKKDQLISLIDVTTGQELASIQLPGWGRLPRWSDDGQNLAIVASADATFSQRKDEFFIVSRDGPEFKRLTHLTEKLEMVHISEYAWSPDGSQIAFWLNTEADDPNLEGTQSELAVLDIASGEITKLCIKGISAPIRSDPMPMMTRTQPVWSPDGRQVVFTQLNPSLTNTYDVLVLDLETKTVFKVTSNKQPVGWMVSLR